MRINYLNKFLRTRVVKFTLNNAESFNGIYSMEYGIQYILSVKIYSLIATIK
jgi:hypothetical protein